MRRFIAAALAVVTVLFAVTGCEVGAPLDDVSPERVHVLLWADGDPDEAHITLEVVGVEPSADTEPLPYDETLALDVDDELTMTVAFASDEDRGVLLCGMWVGDDRLPDEWGVSDGSEPAVCHIGPFNDREASGRG